jgi:GT2 family glycosyltransferase
VLNVQLICATRVSLDNFMAMTALGRSAKRFFDAGLKFELKVFGSNTQPLPIVYNQAIAESSSIVDALVFLHDDVHLIDLHWLSHLELAFGKFDIVGIAGAQTRVARQPAWAFVDTAWTWVGKEYLSGSIAHGTGLATDPISAFGPSGLPCKLLDGVFLSARRETLVRTGLMFDPQFAFHFYDMDFCRQAELKGLTLGTAPISISHESGGSFGDASWQAAYNSYLQKYEAAQ